MVANADGSDARVLIRGDQIDFPRWSPDGSRIVYTDGGRDYVVEVATGEKLFLALGRPADWLDGDTLLIAPQ